MDQFGRLSLDDNVPQELGDGLWNLTLSDQGSVVQTVQSVGDEMDVDMDDIHEVGVEEQEEDEVLPEVEEVSEVEDVPDDHVEEVGNDPETSLIKQLLSPTDLGVAIAKDKGRVPIHININNNNLFYTGSPPVGVGPGVAQLADCEQLEVTNKEKLPVPWSGNSKPVFKNLYDSITYLQFFLNSLTVSVILLFLIKTINSDIKSLWYTNRLKLIHESLQCAQNYKINECHVNKDLPALAQDCIDWEACMNRNNDLHLNNRSIVLFNFIAALLNSLIQPMSFKSIAVIFALILTWIFSSNVILGFARAKSYYGSSSSSTSSSSKELQLSN